MWQTGKNVSHYLLKALNIECKSYTETKICAESIFPQKLQVIFTNDYKETSSNI